MSSTSTITGYQVVISSMNGAVVGTFYADGPDSDGWTDEFALSLAATLNAVAWPSRTTCAVTRTDTAITNYDTNLTADPPVFD